MADTKEKLVSAAISLLEEGSEEEAGFTMRAIAQRAGAAGILSSPPRTTGDGYYEAVIADPDGNLIEIVA